ncbi:sensor histidine kinase [Candidatus Nitrosotenuis chungbukensis]|uniref:sensor histidine kinase n=2 Tax=Candidatus Nitrosotenuis chungbukensis TaxID=1353246 RepID=UPI001EE64705|nr:ATP-binding protein [Candidatus Nitrosotenuis chungbukensis]
MRRFIIRKEDAESSTQSKELDPMSFTERTVFFKKDPNAKNQPTIDDLDKEDLGKEDFKQSDSSGPSLTKSTLELKTKSSNEDKDADNVDKPNNAAGQSQEIKKLFDQSLGVVKEFQENKIKLMYKHLEEEQQLTKHLNDTLQTNLLTISKLDEELEERKNQLEIEVEEKTKRILDSEKLSAIGELSARLAHDIKNPLTTIKSTVKLLKTFQGKPIDEYVMKRFDMMDESIFRISHQVDGVLDYIKKTPLQMEPSSLINIIKVSIMPLTIPKNVQINLPNTDITLKCDSIKMEVVFGNIILNSVQAIGDNPGKIYVRYVETSDYVIIEVADSGPGIPPEILDRVFDPLFTTKQRGTGLGLSSCKNIIEQHGGNMSVKNTPTTFTIRLPNLLAKK